MALLVAFTLLSALLNVCWACSCYFPENEIPQVDGSVRLWGPRDAQWQCRDKKNYDFIILAEIVDTQKQGNTENVGSKVSVRYKFEFRSLFYLSLRLFSTDLRHIYDNEITGSSCNKALKNGSLYLLRGHVDVKTKRMTLAGFCDYGSQWRWLTDEQKTYLSRRGCWKASTPSRKEINAAMEGPVLEELVP